MKIEIEKKFLLKSKPDKEPDEKIKIYQWYYKNSHGIWERVRKCVSNKNNIYFIHTVKKNISRGVNLEDEKAISRDEYFDFINRCIKFQKKSRFISKERWIYKQNDLKWEIDVFQDNDLIIAEIEIPKKNYKFKTPDFIKNKILIEVTGLKQFSNKNLSDPITSQNINYITSININ